MARFRNATKVLGTVPGTFLPSCGPLRSSRLVLRIKDGYSDCTIAALSTLQGAEFYVE